MFRTATPSRFIRSIRTLRVRPEGIDEPVRPASPSRTDISHAAYVAAHAAVQARLDGASIAQEAAVYDAAYAEALDVSRVTG